MLARIDYAWCTNIQYGFLIRYQGRSLRYTLDPKLYFVNTVKIFGQFGESKVQNDLFYGQKYYGYSILVRQIHMPNLY